MSNETRNVLNIIAQSAALIHQRLGELAVEKKLLERAMQLALDAREELAEQQEDAAMRQKQPA